MKWVASSLVLVKMSKKVSYTYEQIKAIALEYSYEIVYVVLRDKDGEEYEMEIAADEQ